MTNRNVGKCDMGFLRKIFATPNYSCRVFIDNFGFKNRGDQLMIQSVMEQVRARIPSAQILVRAHVFRENPSFCMANKLYPLASRNSGSIIRKIAKKISNRLLGDDWIVTPEEIEVVLDCCGYYINDVANKTEESYKNVKHYYELFTKHNIKVIYLPQAFGPFRNEWSQKIGHMAYQRSTKIFAREKESYNYLKELVGDDKKLFIAPDFTCLLSASVAPVVQIPKGQYVLVIPNSNMVLKTQAEIANNYIAFLVAIIDHLNERGENVYLLNHEGDVEEKLLTSINGKLKKPVAIITKISGTDIKGVIKDAKLVITARFHGAVSSLSQHVPTLVTSWSHKYVALLQEHGCEQSLLSVTDIATSIGKINDALSQPAKYVSKEGCETRIEEETIKMWNDVFDCIG